MCIATRALSVQWYFPCGAPDPYLSKYEPLVPRIHIEHEIAVDCVIMSFECLDDGDKLPVAVAERVRQHLSPLTSNSITVYSDK